MESNCNVHTEYSINVCAIKMYHSIPYYNIGGPWCTMVICSMKTEYYIRITLHVKVADSFTSPRKIPQYLIIYVITVHTHVYVIVSVWEKNMNVSSLEWKWCSLNEKIYTTLYSSENL